MTNIKRKDKTSVKNRRHYGGYLKNKESKMKREKRLKYLKTYRRGKIYRLQIAEWYKKHLGYHKFRYRKRIIRDPVYFQRYRELHWAKLNVYWRRYRRKERLRKYIKSVHNQKLTVGTSPIPDKLDQNEMELRKPDKRNKLYRPEKPNKPKRPETVPVLTPLELNSGVTLLVVS